MYIQNSSSCDYQTHSIHTHSGKKKQSFERRHTHFHTFRFVREVQTIYVKHMKKSFYFFKFQKIANQYSTEHSCFVARTTHKHTLNCDDVYSRKK